MSGSAAGVCSREEGYEVRVTKLEVGGFVYGGFE